jgi:hypothetical protein
VLLISWCAARSAAGVAAEVAAGVLPEGCWMFGAVMLGVLALSEEVVLGVDLRGGREPNEALVGVGALSSQGPW